MFTGLVEGVAQVADCERRGDSVDIWIDRPDWREPPQMGESIAIDGCCLTVAGISDDALLFQAGEETLRRTIAGSYKPQSIVNYERSLRLGDRLGGHMVSGHIDAIATVVDRQPHAEWVDYFFEFPAAFCGQIVAKGSVAINGISLTVVAVEDNRFSVAAIPHTLKETNLGTLVVGDRANFETDLLAKYIVANLQAYAKAGIGHG